MDYSKIEKSLLIQEIKRRKLEGLFKIMIFQAGSGKVTLTN
jgi:hypothetical protein